METRYSLKQYNKDRKARLAYFDMYYKEEEPEEGLVSSLSPTRDWEDVAVAGPISDRVVNPAAPRPSPGTYPRGACVW